MDALRHLWLITVSVYRYVIMASESSKKAKKLHLKIKILSSYRWTGWFWYKPGSDSIVLIQARGLLEELLLVEIWYLQQVE